jgi:peptidoglycan/LPS O-acetylase OafA/YrhL
VTHKKNSDIEVLRALAIIFTLIHHLPVLLNWNIGALEQIGHYFGFWGGVDLFFVVSGFVITRSLSNFRAQLSTDGKWGAELKSFYLRRAFRLLPAAWLWLLIPCAISLFATAPQVFPHFETIRNDALAAALNIADWYWPHCLWSGQVATLCSQQMTIGHYWSLSLEEQFYVLLPLLLLGIPRRWLSPLLITAIALQFFWSRSALSFGWYTRTDGLLWGVLLALLSGHPLYNKLEPRFANRTPYQLTVFFILMATIGLSQALLAKFTFGPLGTPYSFAIGTLAACCAAAVYVASFDKNYLFPPGKLKQLLVAVGARSYSLYLGHVTIFALTRELSFHFHIEQLYGRYGLLIIGLLLAAICAELTYRYVEVPTRKLGKTLSLRIVTSEESLKPTVS